MTDGLSEETARLGTAGPLGVVGAKSLVGGRTLPYTSYGIGSTTC